MQKRQWCFCFIRLQEQKRNERPIKIIRLWVCFSDSTMALMGKSKLRLQIEHNSTEWKNIHQTEEIS